MIRRSVITTLLAANCLAAEPSADLLRFKNGDQLHGSYRGIAAGPKLVWQRDDLADPVQFKTDTLRHVVLRNGGPARELDSLSQVQLVNGDQIPGQITAMDDTTITVESPVAGTLMIPRAVVERVAPNPLGGRVHYYGPFSEDGWEMKHPLGIGDDDSPGAGNADHQPELWRHSGSAWYWRGENAGTALVRRQMMSSRCLLRFEVSWKKQLNLAIGLHADFKPVPDPEGENREGRRFIPNDTENLPRLFGNSYVIQLHSNYIIVYQTHVDDQGVPSVERIHTSNSRLSAGENSSANVEVRSDRESGIITLFVDGEFVTQWADPEPAAELEAKPLTPPQANGVGFVAQLNDCALRLTEIMAAEWNGMPDSASSMQSDDRDIVLMANGLDRIAGRAMHITPQRALLFASAHGEFHLPLEEVSELRFARKRLADASEPSANQMTIHFSPLGHISGTPVSATPESILVHHPLLGQIEVTTQSTPMLELSRQQAFFNDWDDHF